MRISEGIRMEILIEILKVVGTIIIGLFIIVIVTASSHNRDRYDRPESEDYKDDKSV